mmetsp:Transcript_20980/g.64995  ORF Transcript_20980/g.64995 Transcript_20980/m.64995 type:complete len:296 (-) Transcript_20980:1311-2198(-)
MHSGGAQKCAQRSQPAQSVFFWVTGLVVRSPKHSFAAVGAARRGHSRGVGHGRGRGARHAAQGGVLGRRRALRGGVEPRGRSRGDGGAGARVERLEAQLRPQRGGPRGGRCARGGVRPALPRRERQAQLWPARRAAGGRPAPGARDAGPAGRDSSGHKHGLCRAVGVPGAVRAAAARGKVRLRRPGATAEPRAGVDSRQQGLLRRGHAGGAARGAAGGDEGVRSGQRRGVRHAATGRGAARKAGGGHVQVPTDAARRPDGGPHSARLAANTTADQRARAQPRWPPERHLPAGWHS